MSKIVHKNHNDSDCLHNWIPLLGRQNRKDIPTALYTCLLCGDLKVGTNTIRISKSRLDMGEHPLKSVSTVDYKANPAAGAATGFMTTLTAGSNVDIGDACEINSSGNPILAKADAIATSSAVVLAGGTISSSSSGLFLVNGIARLSSSPSWTIGGLIYLSTTGTTGNTLTQTAPSGVGHVIQILGVALGADIIYFSPQLVQVEHI